MCPRPIRRLESHGSSRSRMLGTDGRVVARGPRTDLALEIAKTEARCPLSRLARDLARLTDEELLVAYHEDRNPETRDELVKRFIPFARKLALRYVHSREPLDDLVQVASLGLLNAIDRFEPRFGKKFTSYAAPTIVGELKRHFRDKGWAVHVPRDLQERALSVSRHTERLSARLGRSPTVDELSEALACTVEQAIEALDAAHNYSPASLDAPISHEDGRPVRARRDARRRGRRVRARRRPSGARGGVGLADRGRTSGPEPTLAARVHPARDQPAHRLFADARLEAVAAIDDPARRRRGRLTTSTLRS